MCPINPDEFVLTTTDQVSLTPDQIRQNFQEDVVDEIEVMTSTGSMAVHFNGNEPPTFTVRKIDDDVKDTMEFVDGIYQDYLHDLDDPDEFED